jgi:hypothetical protein
MRKFKKGDVVEIKRKLKESHGLPVHTKGIVASLVNDPESRYSREYNVRHKAHSGKWYTWQYWESDLTKIGWVECVPKLKYDEPWPEVHYETGKGIYCPFCRKRILPYHASSDYLNIEKGVTLLKVICFNCEEAKTPNSVFFIYEDSLEASDKPHYPGEKEVE